MYGRTVATSGGFQSKREFCLCFAGWSEKLTWSINMCDGLGHKSFINGDFVIKAGAAMVVISVKCEIWNTTCIIKK